LFFGAFVIIVCFFLCIHNVIISSKIINSEFFYAGKSIQIIPKLIYNL
jgi:hypothetical protein